MCLMLQVSPYPSSQDFPLPQHGLLVVSQGLDCEVENWSSPMGPHTRQALPEGNATEEDCKTSAALRFAPLLLSAASHFNQEMSVRKKWFPETRGVGTALLLSVNTHLFNGWRWERGSLKSHSPAEFPGSRAC